MNGETWRALFSSGTFSPRPWGEGQGRGSHGALHPPMVGLPAYGGGRSPASAGLLELPGFKSHPSSFSLFQGFASPHEYKGGLSRGTEYRWQRTRSVSPPRPRARKRWKSRAPRSPRRPPPKPRRPLPRNNSEAQPSLAPSHSRRGALHSGKPGTDSEACCSHCRIRFPPVSVPGFLSGV